MDAGSSAYEGYTNSFLDSAINAMAGIPGNTEERSVVMEPASANPQTALLIEQMPPNMDTIPSTISAVASIMIVVVTNDVLGVPLSSKEYIT